MKTRLTPRIPNELLKRVRMFCLVNNLAMRDIVIAGINRVKIEGVAPSLDAVRSFQEKKKTSIQVTASIRDELWGIGLLHNLSLETTIAVCLLAGYRCKAKRRELLEKQEGDAK